VSKKAGAALLAGLNVVLCVGESERNNSGDYLEFLRKQITTSLFGIRKKFLSELIIAYEPVWAISKSYGSGEAMTPSDIHETTLFLRKILVEIFGKDWASAIRIIYGGSANAENCQAIIGGGEVDGLLVGRESLNPENFVNLFKAVDVIPL
jgi:triosephosphate isomerase